MEQKKYYVYEWFDLDTNQVFYVGKGTGNRYKDYWSRNNFFKEYYNSHNVDVRIVKYFDDETDAFNYEKELTDSYREDNQCFCNLIDGGFGGYSKIWTDEAKRYKSIYNPMKAEKQRKRMSKNNPMHNPEKRKSMGEKHKRKVLLDGIIYDGLVDIAKDYGVTPSAIYYWIKRGYTNVLKTICYY